MTILATFVVSATVPAGWSLDSGTPLPLREVSTHYTPLAKELETGAALRLSDAGLAPPPPAGPLTTRTIPPRVLRARIEVVTKGGVSSYSTVHIDRSLALALRPGDVVSLKRNGCACIGLWVLRDGQLAVACGAVAGLNLGRDVQVRVAWQELEEAQAVFRRTDPEFEFPEIPVAVSVGSTTRFLLGGRDEMGGYRVWVDHGHFDDVPGHSECVAIWRRDVCPETVAIASALLLDQEPVLDRQPDARTPFSR